MRNHYWHLVLLLLSLPMAAQETFSVFFDFNADIPNAASQEQFQVWMKANQAAEIVKLSGYCDSIDAKDYNVQLASRRIESVATQLAANGIALRAGVEKKPFGENFRQAADAAANRRVDIFFVQPKVSVAGPKGEEVYDDVDKDQPIADKFSHVKKGDIVRLHNINFYFNSEKVLPDSEPKMEELYEVLVQHPKLRIEIHGHICCNPNTADTKLSYRRAKFIFTYLLQKGIPLNRLGYKGFGSANPIYRIPEQTPQQAAANRRVEILITDS